MGIKIIAKNKRAGFDYFLEKKYEAGIQLRGTEIKSIRMEGCHITEAHVSVDDGQAYIHNMYVAHYEFGNQNNHVERRKRKLLLHRREIQEISHNINAGGYSVVPTILYFKKSLVKIEIALAKGKKQYDKRQDKAKKDAERRIKQREYYD